MPTKKLKQPIHAEPPPPAPPVEYVTADALDLTDAPVILYHGCNDVGAWGGGFTGPLTARYPAAFAAYRAWSRPKNPGARGNLPFGLGKVQLVDVETRKFHPELVVFTDRPKRLVCNAITQAGVGVVPGKEPPVRYKAIRESLAACAQYASSLGAYIRMPWVGCGLAGGDRATVQEIIEAVAAENNVRIVVCDLPQPPPPWTDAAEGE